MSYRAVLLLLAVTGCWMLLPSTAHAAFPGQNGKIALSSFRDGNAEIYTMNADGSSPTNLTNHGANDSQPSWSPDGRSIAFVSDRDGDFEIYVMKADGSGLQKLTNNVSLDRFPAWSPDGTKITFDRCCPSPSRIQIFVMNSDGSAQTNISNNAHKDEGPAWSPDGQRIAFSSSRDDPSGGHDEIYVMNSNGTAQTRLTTTTLGHERNPNWSPDGQQLVFTNFVDQDGGDNFVGQVDVMNQDGTARHAVVTPLGDWQDVSPAWSPDGERIAFSTSRDGNSQIYETTPLGVPQTPISANNAFQDEDPDWQPIPYQSTPAPTYDHPRLASPVKVSLVPNFRQTISNSQCTARGGLNSNHGPPLAFSACNPPGFVPGTIAHMGPASSSFATYAVIYGDTNAANGDQANMTLRASMSDIRTAAGADYTPSLTMVTKLRITDRYNGGAQTDPATVSDFETFTPVACTATAGPEGANCNLDSSLDAQTPGAIKENKGTVVQVFRFRVNDSGANGTRGDGDDRTFAVQGIYIP